MTIKKVIFVHGWGGDPTVLEGHAWIGPLQKYCEKRGIEFIAPTLPNTDSPNMNTWIPALKKAVGFFDESTCLVGHSIGCQTIVRFLSGVQDEKIIGKIIFVAPWTHLDKKSIEEEGEESVKIVESWISIPINWIEAKRHIKDILAIFSTNDPYVPLSEQYIFSENLNAKIIVKENEEHFNKTKEIKEITEFIEQ